MYIRTRVCYEKSHFEVTGFRVFIGALLHSNNETRANNRTDEEATISYCALAGLKILIEYSNYCLRAIPTQE